MTDQIEDTVTFNDKLTDIKDYWDLFQTTGWNQKYNFSGSFPLAKSHVYL